MTITEDHLEQLCLDWFRSGGVLQADNGSCASGRIEWKDAGGKTLKELQEQEAGEITC